MSDTELIADYLAYLVWRNRSENTILIRQTYLRHLSRTLGPFESVKGKALKRWLSDPDRKLSPSSQSTYLSTYRSFYTWALKEGKLKRDPTAKIEKPTVKRGEPHPISEDDLERAIEGADAQTRCWLTLGAYAGCRCQEIALMSREDIHDDTMRLFIAHGKGAKSRWVPLHPKILEALQAWEMPAEGRLWPSYTPAQMSKALNGHLHNLGIASVAHSLRHRYATRVYQSSKDLRLTQELLGHSSPSTTAIYAACDMDQAATVVGQI